MGYEWNRVPQIAAVGVALSHDGWDSPDGPSWWFIGPDGRFFDNNGVQDHGAPPNLKILTGRSGDSLLAIDASEQLWRRHGPGDWQNLLPATNDVWGPRTPPVHVIDDGPETQYVAEQDGALSVHRELPVSGPDGSTRFWTRYPDLAILRRVAYSRGDHRFWGLTDTFPGEQPGQERCTLWWRFSLDSPWDGFPVPPAIDLSVDHHHTVWLVMRDGTIRTTTNGGETFIELPDTDFVTVAAGENPSARVKAMAVQTNHSVWYLTDTADG